MKIYKTFEEAARYITGAIARIFSPTDDAYPATGVQPFDGELPKRSAKRDKH